MIPAFTVDGVLPRGRYLASPSELESRFVGTFPTSATRRDLFSGWRARREELREVAAPAFEWVDGSFVTAKPDPGDIDVVTFFPRDVLERLDLPARERVMSLTVGPRPLLEFGCHSFLVVMFDENHPNHEDYLKVHGYWDRWWSKDRSAPSKGYVEVGGGE